MMASMIILVVGVGLLLAAAVAEDKTTGAGGTYCNVKGKSGKVTCGQSENVNDDAGRVTMEIDSITETDTNGNTVGKTGKVKHSLNSMANQDFQITDLATGSLQGLAVSYFSFKAASLSGLTSSLEVKMYFILENGTIYNDKDGSNEEAITVYKGDVKWSILLRNWQWCGTGTNPDTCAKGEVGSYLDLVIQIKGKDAAKKSNNGNFELGDGASIQLSNKVKADGVWTTMADPTYATQGSKQLFTFRFSQFNDEALYDPVFRLGGAGANTVSMAMIIMVALATAYQVW